MKIVIVTIKSWNIANALRFAQEYSQHEIKIISRPEDLTVDFLNQFSPDYIFFPHWSWIIPEEIYGHFTCIVFHMTDLPFGRGGSPLQNLLVRGIYQTKISALRVDGGLDSGAIYFKEDFDISSGSAQEIFERASSVIFNKMIPRFVSEPCIPHEQEGTIVRFERRKPAQSEIPAGLSSRQLYDYIRMLDAEGYPAAYIKTEQATIYFHQAHFENGRVTASATFEVNVI